MPEIPTSVVILAAGYSTRMGQPKIGLKLPDGISFLEHISGQYHDFGCTEIVVVINKGGIEFLENNQIKLPENITICINPQPWKGRFSSLQCGFNALKKFHPTFIHNIDNPFTDIDLLEKLVLNLGDYDFVKPVFHGKGGHPVLIGQKVIIDAKQEQNTRLPFRDFLGRYNGIIIQVSDESILTNLNTPEDLEIFSLIKKVR